MVVYPEDERQVRITNEDVDGRVFVRLVDLATHMTVSFKFYDVKPWVDLSEELIQGLKIVAGVYMRQTTDEEFLKFGIPRDGDGCQRECRKQGVHAKTCPAEIPF